ncbi:hypothetical protein [Pelomonas sp. Root1217]|uniref:hypothetical protein n=1 Tax=Pelomonas sp. Root1217 TaxID=1736430 RepID=UPI0012FB29EF|nr:hypothetical protein [Pelomonas sp. Root1217]
MQRLALLLGVIVALQGVVGLVAPDAFVDVVRFFQTPPTIYFAAVVRMAFGLVLVRAARHARAAVGLRALGIAIVIGGALTPFLGVQLAQVILGWWAEGGAAVVRAWAFASLAIGAFIIYATSQSRRSTAIPSPAPPSAH